MSITETLADSLKYLSDNDGGFQNVKSGAGNVLTVLGGMTTAGSGGGNDSTSSPTNKSETAVCIVPVISL
jgi:hypothetical protein